MIDKKIITSIIAALGASLCCITPVLAVLAGSTGLASSFSWMEPFRPYLIALTILVLAYAWWDKLKIKKIDIECACDPYEGGKVSFWHTKIFLAIITIFSAVTLSFPYWGDTFISSNAPIVEVQTQNLRSIEVAIEGMTCKACEATIEKVVLESGGVSSAKASSVNKNAMISFDVTKTDVNSIVKAIATTGYKAVRYKENGKIKLIISNKINKDESEFQKEIGVGKCGSK